MVNTLSVIPAYGRKYNNMAAAIKDWKDGKDFIITDIMSKWNGKPCSARDFEGKDTTVYIRYGGKSGLDRVCVAK